VAASSFSDLLEQQPIVAVYLFLGEAGWHTDRAWSQIYDRLVPAAARRFNGESLQAKEVSAIEVVERLATLSMFGPKRLVRVRQVETWNKEQQAIISSYLVHPNPAACLVLQGTSKKGCEALITAVQKAGGKVLELSAPSGAELPRWLQEQAGLRQKQINLQAAALLVERAGTDLTRLAGELDKLCAFLGERKRIETMDIDAVVSHQRQFTVFELVSCVGKCQAGRAIAILRQLLLAGEAPLAVLALLARHLRILWQVQDGLERGLSVEAIGQKIKLPVWVLKKEYLPNVGLFSPEALFRAHRAMVACDVALKSTAGSPESLLEALVLGLCRQRQKGPGASAPGPGKLACR
jgi:DNA polymerase-3 subunit delta